MRRSLALTNPSLILCDETSTDTLKFVRTNAGEPYRELLAVRFETGACGDWSGYDLIASVDLDLGDVARLRDFLNTHYPEAVTGR